MRLELPKNVLLVAATKYASADQVNALLRQGIKAVGENRVQDAEQKFPYLLPCEKHFIGWIQSNKIRKIVSLFDVVESLCSLKHAEKLNNEGKKQNKIMRVFVQVNAGGEEQKQGMPLDEEKVRWFLNSLKPFAFLRVEGLMIVTPLSRGPEFFEKAKALFDSLKNEFNLRYLSMGASDDYEKAIKAGANLVRIGRALFQT